MVRSYDCCGDRDTRELACVAEVIDLNDLSWIKSLGPSERFMLAGGLEDCTGALELLSQVDPTIIPEQYLQMRDWRNWRQWALGSALQFPSTYAIEEWHTQLRPMVEPGNDVMQPSQRWLWKKQRSAGGLGVKFVNSKELEEPSLLRANGLSESGILQKYVSGKSIGVSFLSSPHGTVIVGMAESLPLQPHIWSDFIYRGSIAPVSIPEWLVPSVSSFAKSVVSSTGWRGLWQADFILSEKEIYLLEINPRWTASMELIVCGYDLPLVTWHMGCGQFEASDWKCIQSKVGEAHGKPLSRFRKEILYAQDDSVVSLGEGEKWWGRRWIARECDGTGLWYADIPNIHSTLNQCSPVCSVIERVE